MTGPDELRLRYGPTTYAVFQAIHEAGSPVSRLQIAQSTGLHAKAIDNALVPLLGRGYVVKVARGLYTVNGDVK